MNEREIEKNSNKKKKIIPILPSIVETFQIKATLYVSMLKMLPGMPLLRMYHENAPPMVKSATVNLKSKLTSVLSND